MPQTILFLAANPDDTMRLRLDRELREIAEGLQRARRRDAFRLEQRWAVRPRDMHRALLDVRPQIVHFSGHGTDGILMEDDSGYAQTVSGEALAGLFELFAAEVRCVLFNACYSEPQAAAVARHIDYVAGMRGEVSDRAALEFAVAFYDALGAGESFDFAFKLAERALQMTDPTASALPVLKANPAPHHPPAPEAPPPSGGFQFGNVGGDVTIQQAGGDIVGGHKTRVVS